MADLVWAPTGSNSGLLWPIHTGTVKWKQAPSPCSETTQILSLIHISEPTRPY